MRREVGESRVGRLATVTADGRPHVVPCCYSLVGDVIYSAVDGKPKSTLALRRLDNIRTHPYASLVVDHYTDDWMQLWWVRIDALARVLESGEERDGALDALAGKYEQYAQTRPPGAVIALDITKWTAWP
jgi:PPOX class probable F420-dependent enzyme